MGRHFDAVDDNLLVDSVPVGSPPFTIACWANLDQVITDQHLVSLCRGAEDTHFHSLHMRGTASAVIWAGSRTTGAFNTAATTTSATAGTWHHMAGVWSASNSRAAFLDGGGKGTNTTSTNVTGLTRLSIGQLMRSTPPVGEWTDGLLAEIGVWNVALTDTEVLVLSKGVSPRNIRPANLAFYAPLWGTSSPERDYTAGQRHLTITGATSGAQAPTAPALASPQWTPAAAAVAAAAPSLALLGVGA